MVNHLGPLLDACLEALNSGLEGQDWTGHASFDPRQLIRRRRLLEGACLAIAMRASLSEYWAGEASSVEDSHRELQSILPGSFTVFCLEECTGEVEALERLLAVANGAQLQLADVAALREFLHSLDVVRRGPSWQVDPGEDARKRLGAFYTPATLARAITRQATSLWRRAPHDDPIPSLVDASVGAGEFLLAALDELASASPPVDRLRLARHAFGFDVDPLATELALLRVARWADALDRVDVLRGNFAVGNPLLSGGNATTPLQARWELALVDRYWAPDMGLLGQEPLSRRFDLVVGNPPWEKLRVEERRFFAPYSEEVANSTNKRDRQGAIQRLRQHMPLVCGYYDQVRDDIEGAREGIRNEPQLELGARGELMTAPLFTALALSQLADEGALGLLVKSSVLTSRPLLGLAEAVADLGEVRLLEFINREGLFPIDSRERFTAIIARRQKQLSLEVATGLVSAEEAEIAPRAQITRSLRHSMSDVGLPLIGDTADAALLSRLADSSPHMDDLYPGIRFGRIVHLTAHAEDLRLDSGEGWLPVLEGKMIWRYSGRYATYEGVSRESRMRPKAAARPVPEDKQRDRSFIPERRWFIDSDAWKELTKNYPAEFSLYWRNTTSASNARAVVATILPHQPSTQSLQLLQLQGREPDELALLLAVMNSSIFEWVVRRFMTGIDLTSSIVRRVPVPEAKSWDRVTPAGPPLRSAVLGRVAALLRADRGLDGFTASLPAKAGPVLDAHERERYEAEIDVLVARAYGLGNEELDRVTADLPHSARRAVREATTRLQVSDVA